VTNIAHPLESKILEAHHWLDKDFFFVPDVYANYIVLEPILNLEMIIKVQNFFISIC